MKLLQWINKNRNLVLRWFGTITAVALLVTLFKGQGWTDIKGAVSKISLVRLLICLILVFISRFAVIGRWHVLLSAVDNVPIYQSFRLTFAGLFATNFLPTTVGGDIVRLAGSKQLHIDFVSSAASLVVDRLIGMVGMVIALPFGAPSLIAWMTMSRLSQYHMYWAGAFTWGTQILEKMIKVFGQIYRSFLIWKDHPKSLFLSLGFTFIHMFCFFWTLTLLFRGMGEHPSLWMVGGLWSFVYLVTLFPISINGYGVQEISMTFIFSEVGGLSIQNCLAVSVIFRLLLILASVPGAVFLPGIIAGSQGLEDENIFP